MQAAADVLFVTTSAVSQQIAKLEREVGQPLVERYGRTVRPTEAARVLLERTAAVFSTLEKVEGELDAMRGVVSGTLRLSAFPTAARGFCPKLLIALRSKYPDLTVSLSEQEPLESLPQLARGDIDVVIAQDWFNAPLALPDGLAKLALFDDSVDVALPANHRLARRRSVNLDDLADDKWVTWPDGSICHDWLLHTLRTAGHEPKIAHTASEHATQLALVAAGLGCAIVPRLGRTSAPEDVKYVHVVPTLYRHVFAAWREDNSRRTALAGLQSTLLQVKKSFGQ
jgi:DNA-binding transcriptional LysR family regulator